MFACSTAQKDRGRDIHGRIMVGRFRKASIKQSLTSLRQSSVATAYVHASQVVAGPVGDSHLGINPLSAGIRADSCSDLSTLGSLEVIPATLDFEF